MNPITTAKNNAFTAMPEVMLNLKASFENV